MRVLLAIAPWSYETVHPGSMLRGAIFGTVGGASEPLGLLYLGAVLKRHGHVVTISDGALLTGHEILARARSEEPDLIGISAMTHNWGASMDLARSLRQVVPRATFVLGGPHATGWGAATLQECPAFDIAVIGDGERTLVEVCESIGGSFAGVAGIAWRDGDRIVTNLARPPMESLDEIPFPDYGAIDLRRYRPSIGFYRALPSMNLMTSRGCPSHCTFCVSHGKLLLRSVDNVVDEIRFMVARHGIRHVAFYDEGFTVSKERALALCDGMRAAGIRIPWCANARVDQVDRDVLRAMKEAGCWKVLFGIESGVQKNLDAIRKGIRVEQSEEAVRLAHDIGIETFGTFLFGIPGETFDEGLRTIAFACRLPLDYAAFLNLVPYKGTEIYENVGRYGALEGRWSTNLISFVPHSMKREELVRLNVMAARSFYRRPRYLARRFLAMRSLEDLKRNVRGFLAFPGIRESDY